MQSEEEDTTLVIAALIDRNVELTRVNDGLQRRLERSRGWVQELLLDKAALIREIRDLHTDL